ncbi:hypothetical protein niasHT_003540 [Heterodera trifolii]|uniref:Uncharacterized protein n=2 Tax=Heterodera trifolii TaxID=157864 RepID=A0ABD2M5P8_9BILA
MRRPYYQAPRPSAAGRIQSPTFTTPNNLQQQKKNHKANKTTEACQGAAAVAQRRHQQQKMTDRECSGFEPQNYLRDRCKKCFRLREKHGGIANFAGASSAADQPKETETSVRSQLRSPIVTVRRAQSNPTKMLTTTPRRTTAPAVTTSATSSSSSTPRKPTHQQQQSNKRSNWDKTTEDEGQTTTAFGAVRKTQTMQRMRTIAIETDEMGEGGQNANGEEKMPKESEEGKTMEEKSGKRTTTTAAEGGGRRRRTWKLSTAQETTKTERNLEDEDEEDQRHLQQNGCPARQQKDTAQPRPPSATTTVLLAKQRQISLGHSNSLREQRKKSESWTTDCATSTENGIKQSTSEEQQNGETTRRASSTRRTTRTEKKEEEEKENGGRAAISERNGSWQFMGDKFRQADIHRQNVGKGNDDDAADEQQEEEELLSLSSYKSANSLLDRSVHQTNTTTTVDEMFSARSVESLNSLSCAESFKTGKSPPFDDPMEDPFMTPKSTSETQHFFGSDDDEFERAMTPTAMEFNQQEFFHIRGENRRLQEQCRRFRHERKRWTEWLRKKYGNWKERENGDKREQQTTTTVTLDGQRMMEEALIEMETMLNEYREENSALKGQLVERREGGFLHNRDMMSASASTVISNGACSAPAVLEERLQMSESMCEQLRRERKELEREIEEMQDQYRVEEIEEFRELQRELEQSAKNGRILQFKLRKAERQRDQLQTEKNLLARKVQEIQRGIGGGAEQIEEMSGESDMEEQMGRKVSELEQELRVAKEVSLKMHNELEVAEEKRYKLEDELFYQKEKVRELLAQNRWREARQMKGRSVEEALLEAASRSTENLPKEVRDTLEREADLREQLRFTEADLQRTRQRLDELERENDELLQRYSNLAQRHSEAQSKSTTNVLRVPQKQKTVLRSISEGADEIGPSAAEQQNERNKSEERKSEQSHGRSASAVEINRTPIDKEKKILIQQSEDSREKLSTMAEEANELRRKCVNCESEIGELRESAVTYKRMNEQLKEQMEKMKEEWKENERSKETKSMEKAQKFEKELKIVQKHFGDECRKRESAERSLAENRAVLEKLNTTIIETNAELNQARQKIGEMEQEQDKLKKWENKCKEMKQERVRIQANAMELKKRTDEAVQELGKMSRTHQQKEIGWMREKKHLEEQLRELTKPTTGGKKVSESSSQSSTTTTESNKRTTTERVEELEQEKKCLEAKMEELRKIREQEMAAHQTEKIEWQREREQMGGRAHKMNGATSLCQAVDYKQIADNALRAAEELQKQYREYQRHYTAEVQRLSGQLVKLEQELATRQQQITVVAPTETVADQKQDENNKDNDAVNVSAVIKMPTQHQAQHVTRPHRGYESPSMSSLTENNFTDNTTWDSRLLDCGSMMTRSISPLKGQSAMFRGGSTVPMLQCRAVDIHPSSPLAGLGQRAIGVMDDGDFGSVDDVQQKYRRTGSAGTNILYRIRREELAQGKHPTVRQMARAFESFEKLQQKGNSSEEPKRKRIKPTKGGLFGLLGKSSSMEVSSMSEKNLKTPKAFRKGEHVPSEKMPGSNEKNPRRRRQSFAVSVVVSSARGAQSVQGNNRDGGQSRDGTPSQNTIGITSDDFKWN